MVKEGIDEETLAQVDSGPLAEAKALRSELKANVAQGPAELRKQEQSEKAGMEKELGAAEKVARGKMKGARKTKLGTVKGRQVTAKKSEEDIRKKVTDDIQKIYEKAKTSVATKLANLEKNSLKRFDDGQNAATDRFENRVNREMKALKARRYSGIIGKGNC